MHVLFIDDSYNSNEKYLGHGGFCIEDNQIGQLTKDIVALKSRYNIPKDIELKWSLEPKHYLRTKFTGSRKQLYLDAIQVLRDNHASLICAAHDLKACYGIESYGWSYERARIWGTKQQLKYISERFEKPYLTGCGDCGLIIIDEYGGSKRELSVTEQISRDISLGTKYRQFEKLTMLPMTTISKYCLPLQLADLIIGIVVSTLAGSAYAARLFENLSQLFLVDPFEQSIEFACTFSSAVLGFGLTLFPQDFRQKRGIELFNQLDLQYIYTNKGFVARKL